MSNTASELANGFQLLGLQGGVSRPFERILLAQPLGDVWRDLDETGQIARFAMDGIDDRVYPKSASILANAPTLGLVSALAGGGLKCSQVPLRTPVCIGIENRKVLPDDLVRAIPFDAFGSRIPGRHLPIRVHHVDRVVGDGLDKRIQLVLSVRNRLCGLRTNVLGHGASC